MICRGVCAYTEMLWMCVLYVSFWSKVRPRTFGCVAMGNALLFIVRSRLLVYSAGSGVSKYKLFCLGLVRGCFVLSRKTLYVGMVVCISWLPSYLCVCGCDCDVVFVGHDLVVYPIFSCCCLQAYIGSRFRIESHIKY